MPNNVMKCDHYCFQSDSQYRLSCVRYKQVLRNGYQLESWKMANCGVGHYGSLVRGSSLLKGKTKVKFNLWTSGFTPPTGSYCDGS